MLSLQVIIIQQQKNNQQQYKKKINNNNNKTTTTHHRPESDVAVYCRHTYTHMIHTNIDETIEKYVTNLYLKYTHTLYGWSKK